MINNRLKQNFFTFYETANSSVKIFLHKVYIVYSKCAPSAETHLFRRLRKSLTALLIVVCVRQVRSAAVHFLALEWSLALGEVCEMPEALHPTHGSQVG